MPKLETIADWKEDNTFSNHYNDFSIYTQGKPLNLSLPALWNVSDVDCGMTGERTPCDKVTALAADIGDKGPVEGLRSE